MTDNTQPDALRLADASHGAVQMYPQTSEDEPGGYCTEQDQLMDDAATALCVQHARIEELEAQLESIGAGGVSALMGAAKAGSDGVASLPLPGAQEPVAPHGWLYDWTHSSATGRPDETYTGFTKDEQHARKHDNCTPVYTAPHPALSAGWQPIETEVGAK